MVCPAIIQERIRLGDHGRLSGMLAYPAQGMPERAALICPPHPNFAGDMTNNVVTAVADALSHNMLTLRFDYRGVGESRICLEAGDSALDYWDRVESQQDYGGALADAADAADVLEEMSQSMPILALGYSFGAFTALQTACARERILATVGIAAPFKRICFDFLAACTWPCLLISGDQDFVYDPSVTQRLAQDVGERLTIDLLSAQDHFFRGSESMLAERILRFISTVPS